MRPVAARRLLCASLAIRLRHSDDALCCRRHPGQSQTRSRRWQTRRRGPSCRSHIQTACQHGRQVRWYHPARCLQVALRAVFSRRLGVSVKHCSLGSKLAVSRHAVLTAAAAAQVHHWHPRWLPSRPRCICLVKGLFLALAGCSRQAQGQQRAKRLPHCPSRRRCRRRLPSRMCSSWPTSRPCSARRGCVPLTLHMLEALAVLVQLQQAAATQVLEAALLMCTAETADTALMVCLSTAHSLSCVVR